jgi:hypothetical protein
MDVATLSRLGGHMANPIEELASKAMGGTKAIKATLEGLSGVFRKLAQEHGEVSALLLRVKNSDDLDLRAKLFPEIRKNLLAHEKGELGVVYPAFRAHPELAIIADKHAQEASQLEKMLAQLTATPVRDPAWPSSFDALVDLVQNHVKEEETQFFPAGERAFGGQTKALQEQYETLKAQVMQQLD